MQLYALMTRFELETESGDLEAIAEVRKGLQFFDVHYEELDTSETVLPSHALELAWERRFDEAYRLLLASAEHQIEPDRAALRWAEVALYASACGARADARKALSAVRRALANQSGKSVRAYRAQVLAAVALAVLGRRRISRALLESLESTAPSSRLRALLGAARELERALAGGRNARVLDDAMNALRSHESGGIARALLALPRTQRRNAVAAAGALQNDIDEFSEVLLQKATLEEDRSVEVDTGVRVLAERLCEFLDEANARSLRTWMDAFVERYRNAESIRTVVSLAPSALQEFLAVRRVEPAQADVLAAMDGVVQATMQRYQRLAAPARVELVDEIDAAINALIARLDAADPLTGEHSRAVASWCSRLARKLGLGHDEIVLASRSGLIHDVGKTFTPIEVLCAPRSLTAEEWEVMRAHAAVGEEIVLANATLAHLAPAVRSHHERLDGRGYPDGTAGSKIPFMARLVAVADCFNAMIGRRPYRRPMPPSIALMEIERHRGTQFDPEIADALIQVVRGA